MKALLDGKVWSGPLGVARIVAVLSATWVIVTNVGGIVGVIGYSPAKAAVSMGIMLASLAFIAGFQMGQARR